MTDIVTNVDLAEDHAAAITTDDIVPDIENVSDDNTEAEANVYGSHAEIKSAYALLASSLRTDAGRIQETAKLYEALDAQISSGFTFEQEKENGRHR